MRKRKSNFPAKPLALVFIILLALCIILGYIWRVITASEYFQVKDILSKEALNVDLSYLKGRNIFSLNLPKEAAAISRACPDCSHIRIARVIPNRIFVELIKRKPIAFIKLYRYFAVDEDGYIFSSLIQPEDPNLSGVQPNLPVITGLETRIFGPKPGTKYENRELSVALSILKETARNPVFKNYRIQKINIAGINDITVQIPISQAQPVYSGWKAPGKIEFLEVKIGQGNISDKVAIMSGLINQEKQNISNIKYIDLRFNEPVIKFKEDRARK
ncbi:MAG: hypothetical protein V1869_04315 [Candidatus Omnitrophota bacterium]